MKLRKMFLLTLVCVVFVSFATHSSASPEGRYQYVEHGKDVAGELILFSAEDLGSIVKIQTVKIVKLFFCRLWKNVAYGNMD